MKFSNSEFVYIRTNSDQISKFYASPKMLGNSKRI